MKVLHVTPHLGGGVGKAHAALQNALPSDVEQTFVLLEPPRDRRYLEQIEANAGRVVVAGDLDEVAYLAGATDIVQFEFWNHPRMFECLACCPFPPMRSVFWSHISGLSRPLIPPGLMEEAARFVFTTKASLDGAAVARISEPARLAVINSGFGFAGPQWRVDRRGEAPAIAYLGTVDFVKMHPGFFDAIDRLTGDIQVSVWGATDPSGPVAARARAMRHPERIDFRGEAFMPMAVLSDADIFFYPLQPDHYGTAENALVEAMSLGLVPVVLNNPAERAIVRDGETGFIAHSIEKAASVLQMLLRSPHVCERVSRNASKDVMETRTAELSARDFMVLWLGLLAKPPRLCDFRAAVGGSPAEWFTATRGLPGAARSPETINPQQRTKGSLAHFESVFAGDASLARLRR